MTIRLLRGDCRETLPTLEPGSVQAVITSPPYYGLREYGTSPLVWGGDVEHEHEWGESVKRPFGGAQGLTGDRVTRTFTSYGAGSHQFCTCGAWLGSLGLEPTPELYVEHLVECFRHVRRVLADTGCLWLNLGDSYAGSGKGPSNNLNLSNPHAHEAAESMRLQRIGPQEHTIGHGRVPGLKPKDLMLMPFRVAMALQADGWWLRSVIPWLKRNSMPESVTDRPSTSVEYVFLLAKSRTYHWNADAVRHEVGHNTHERGDGVNPKSRANGYAPGQDSANMPRLHRARQNESFSAAVSGPVTSRNRRNSDWFFESWQGLMLDEDDAPMALVVNPQPFSGAHFATFPARLVEPMVKASTRPGDTVLDPFSGAGTVAMVADRLGRHAIGCELSLEYGELATERLVNDSPMFTEIVA